MTVSSNPSPAQPRLSKPSALAGEAAPEAVAAATPSASATGWADEQRLLQLDGISKTFPGVRALDDVSLEVHRGRVHALLGENGAGKSTLLKILSGVLRPDRGEILVEGRSLHITGPGGARQAGIAMIHQELQQVPELDVTQNLFLGMPITRLGVFNNVREMREKARAVLARLGATIDVTAQIKTLGVAERQLVEIGRALLQNARIIAMDEPTSSLTPGEVDQLSRVIGELTDKGVAIIYVSHRLGEVFRICDMATILRDGRKVADISLDEATEEDIVRLMVGRKLEHQVQRSHARDEVVLSVRDLSWGRHVRGVSFDLRRGEILGVAGLVGAGRTELVQLVAGVRRPTSGRIVYRGAERSFANPRQAIRCGIGMVPEDRKREGIVPLRPVLANAGLPKLGSYTRLGIIDGRRHRDAITRVAHEVDLKPMQLDRAVALFSGGNQQKVIIARWLNAETEVMIFDEPTRGIDVGAKLEIYRLMEALAEKGKAILMVSSELPEILRMSDRVLVMRRGKAAAVLDRSEMSEDAIARHSIMEAAGEPEPDATPEEHRP